MAMRRGWSVCVMLVLGCSQPNSAFDEPELERLDGRPGPLRQLQSPLPREPGLRELQLPAGLTQPFWLAR